MKATAVCHGAATIITAFATGRGGAYGIGLSNRTTVELDGSQRTQSTVNGEPGVGQRLAEAAVRRALGGFGVKYTGARVTTESDIPLAAGLKSSSVAANAIVLASVGAIAGEQGDVKQVRMGSGLSEQRITIAGRTVTAEEIINLGIDAAFDADVTVTGALDDASAAYLGGYTLTDNLKRKVVYHGGMEEGLTVLVHLPEGRIYSSGIRTEEVKAFAKEIDLLWEEARAGRIYSAITLNGLVHCAAFGLPFEPAMRALRAGAIAAGLSGTGPAAVAITRGDGDEIAQAWAGLGGRIIRTTTNNERARLIP